MLKFGAVRPVAANTLNRQVLVSSVNDFFADWMSRVLLPVVTLSADFYS